MIVASARIIKSAATKSHSPEPTLPEIAFAGRSNVGKSSLINTLVNRKRLVKTSSTPGRTQLINFFDVNDAVIFVDLPGYGYARAPEKIRKQWGPMIETYLSTRSTLQGVVVILDIRRTPGVEERDLLAWLDHQGVPALPVLTKVDKLSKTRAAKQRAAIARDLGVPPDLLILFSAKTRQGKDAVLDAIDDRCGLSAPAEAEPAP